MTMLDVFYKTVNSLPFDLSIESAKEYHSKVKIEVKYDGTKATVELNKMCTPGAEKDYCWSVIATAMSEIYMNKGDLEKARLWLNALHNKKLITESNH